MLLRACQFFLLVCLAIEARFFLGGGVDGVFVVKKDTSQTRKVFEGKKKDKTISHSKTPGGVINHVQYIMKL